MDPQFNGDIFGELLEKECLSENNLLNFLPVAAYVCDQNGVIQKFNKACVDLWGVEPVAGKDKWCGSWKAFDSQGKTIELGSCPMALTLAEGKAVTGVEIIIERPDGLRRRINPMPRPIFDKSGRLLGAINVLVDVTIARDKEQVTSGVADTLEKKVTERTADLLRKNEELQKSEERYHKMVEEVQDYAILLLDRDGTILNWNRGAERIKGYTEEEIVGKNFSIFYRQSDRDENLPQNLIAIAIKEGRAVHEGPRVRKDGSLFWGSITITALHDKEGNVIGFSKVTRDLTEKKLTEDQIRQYTEDLEFQNKELEQFAYAAAHDMKEPLRKILFYNNHLFDCCLPMLPEKAQDYVKRSLNAASRMQKLIDDLLTYSRASAKVMEPETVSLNELLQEAIAAQQDTIRQTRTTIKADPLPDVTGIPFQIRQLFDNLIGNAIKYRHSSRSPEITISCRQVTGGLSGSDTYLKTKYLQVRISDNGVGFDPKYKDQLFNLFQRLHSETEYQGTGIGLAICKRIMQNHHGFITADGKVGEGAVFTLYFPLK